MSYDTSDAVEELLSKRKKRVCRWCRKALEEFWISGDDKVWHFLCGECAAKFVLGKRKP